MYGEYRGSPRVFSNVRGLESNPRPTKSSARNQGPRRPSSRSARAGSRWVNRTPVLRNGSGGRETRRLRTRSSARGGAVGRSSGSSAARAPNRAATTPMPVEPNALDTRRPWAVRVSAGPIGFQRRSLEGGHSGIALLVRIGLRPRLSRGRAAPFGGRASRYSARSADGCLVFRRWPARADSRSRAERACAYLSHRPSPAGRSRPRTRERTSRVRGFLR